MANVSGSARGIPLLSGLPPANPSSRAETACRKCNKEFNILFARAKKCNHCGYAYCSSCVDHQALAPREGATQSGYDILPVCGFCIEWLSITANGKAQLRSLPVTKLRAYLKAYDIKPQSVLEKDDLIEAIISARTPNGCLPPEKENYYRMHSVPNKPPERQRSRNPFSRGSEGLAPPNIPPRPRSAGPTGGAYQATSRTPSRNPQHQAGSAPSPTFHHPQPTYPPPPQRQSQYGSAPSNHHGFQADHTHPPPPSTQYRQPTVPPPPTRPTSVPPAAPPRQPASVPSLRSLLSEDDAYISALSVSALKGILSQNHVNARLILEKGELVAKVKSLLENERLEREREEAYRVAEEAELAEREQERTGSQERRESLVSIDENELPDSVPIPEGNLNQTSDSSKIPDETTAAPLKPATVNKSITPLERTGLCVVCQDEDANVAIVDCGHLALCMGCSDLIMKTTHECPLCRTRIVTEQRLLRIFRS